jgi:aryl-alcohol dehydrogenase-like predicted oxidoreductase
VDGDSRPGSLGALTTALDLGVTFIDTTRRLWRRALGETIAKPSAAAAAPSYIATKAGKRLPTQATSGYTLENLGNGSSEVALPRVDILDLVQLLPADRSVLSAIVFVRLTGCGRKLIWNYRVSVRDRGGVKAIDIKCRERTDHFQHLASAAMISSSCRRRMSQSSRVPLASGLLSGKFTRLDL